MLDTIIINTIRGFFKECKWRTSRTYQSTNEQYFYAKYPQSKLTARILIKISGDKLYLHNSTGRQIVNLADPQSLQQLKNYLKYAANIKIMFIN